MVTKLFAVAVTSLLVSVPAVAVQLNGRMVAEIGVNNVQSALIRRDVPASPTAKETPAKPKADDVAEPEADKPAPVVPASPTAKETPAKPKADEVAEPEADKPAPVVPASPTAKETPAKPKADEVAEPKADEPPVPASPNAKETPAKPQADAVDEPEADETPAVATTTLPPTTSDAYSKAVLKSKPVAYWQLGELSGNRADAQGPACGQDGGVSFGDPCAIAGNILGTPALGANSLIPSNTNDKAISFDGSSNQEVVIPDSAFLNTNDEGYLARTVELWFEAGDLGGINRTVYEEGNAPHAGLSIYASDSGTTTELFMYAWDRGNNEVDFGTSLINPDPIRCAIQKDTPYYVALVFSNADLAVTGYIKRPTSNKVELCGKMTGLPKSVKLRHHGHGGGNAIIGGVQGTARATGTTQMDGNSHNFVGTIDEVAVYNRALPESELQAHVIAASTAPAAVTPAPIVAAAPVKAPLK